MNDSNMQELTRLIQNNVHSVDIVKKNGDVIQFNGTAFSVSSKYAITAHHVVDHDDIESIKLVGKYKKPLIASVMEFDSLADIALLELESDIEDVSSFVFSPTPPLPGTKCIWGGFPTLIGEFATRRLRYAQGMISSVPYGTDRTCFFEIDGMFSPGHSGSPILEYNSGQLVGIVTSSAGNLYDHFHKARDYIDSLRALSSNLDILFDIIQTLETFGEYTRKLESFLEVACGLEEDTLPSISIHEKVSLRFNDELRAGILETLEDEQINLTTLVHQSLFDGSPVKSYQGRVSVSTIFRALIGLLLKWSDAVEFAIDESFQMGIGVASGGKRLSDFLSSKE